MAINPADLQAIQQAIIGAINTAAGSSGTSSPVADETARLNEYLQALQRTESALLNQEQAAAARRAGASRDAELNRIAIEQQRNIIETAQARLDLERLQGPVRQDLIDQTIESISLATKAIEQLEEDNRQREKSIELLKKQKQIL